MQSRHGSLWLKKPKELGGTRGTGRSCDYLPICFFRIPDGEGGGGMI